jgi:peptide/nickel transport system ATP-binding protein
MSENLLEVQNLTKVFSTGFLKKKLIKAVDDVSFKMPRNIPTMTTLAGESGSGKSTIARLLLMLIPPTSGKIIYDNKDVRDMSRKERMTYRKDVQAIFQDPYQTYNPFYKVDRMLEKPVRKFKMATSKKEKQKLISETLERVGLKPDEILGKFPHQLSGGERQRVMLARAFLLNPRIIVADEPVSMVDASLRANILNDMTRLKKDYKVSFLYITHDLSTAYTISDNIIILYRGSVVEMGDVTKVIKNPMHPYLQKLVSSVPVPDPDRRWIEKVGVRTEEITYTTEKKGCRYYDMCIRKEEKCLHETPKMVTVEEGHQVTCNLYCK